MKKSWLLAIGYWLLAVGARAQDAPHYETQTNIKLENTFTAKKLSAEELAAFELRAEQKLKDFYNYLEVISNPKYDKKLRQDARTQVLELFVSGEKSIVDGKAIDGFLDSCMDARSKTIPLPVTEINITKGFNGSNPVNPAIYTGTISFSLSRVQGSSEKHQADIMLIKTEKLFGTEKKLVWTVYLVEIK
ncbi:MAG TPA: hypothetical protein VI112_00355 [Bacteroidia bacterium]|jgi:hypothetical protein